MFPDICRERDPWWPLHIQLPALGAAPPLLRGAVMAPAAHRPHAGRPAVGDTPSRSPWSRWARDRFARGVGRALLNPAKAVVFRVLRLTVLSDVAFY